MAIGNELDFSPTSSSTTNAGTANTLARPISKTYKSPKSAKLEFGPKAKFGMGKPSLMPSKGGVGKKGMPKTMSKR